MPSVVSHRVTLTCPLCHISDGDGDLEIITSDFWGTTHLYINDGSGGFSHRDDLSITSYTTYTKNGDQTSTSVSSEVTHAALGDLGALALAEAAV